MTSIQKNDFFKRITRFGALVLLTVCAFVVVSCDDDDDENRPTESIAALAIANDDLSTLEAALTKFPDLVTTLSGNGTFTVFAPTNQAFQNLLTAIGQTSLDDVPDNVLRDILEYHVLATTVRSNQLSNTDVTTVGGEDIAISITNGVRLNGSTSVVTADISATNGVVHVIDAVLVPPSISRFVGTVVAPAYFNKNFTTLIAAVNGASPTVLNTLLNSTRKTLFAPTNAAFTAAGINASALPGTSVLDAVLTYHVIPSEVRAANIANGSSSATTLNGRIYLSKGSSVFINGTTRVTTTDIVTNNGVVHVIDRTLLPPSQTIAQIAVASASASSPQFTQLVAALQRTQGQTGGNDLLAAVSNAESNLTVFAPTDAAFQELYTTLGVSNVNQIPLATLINVLKHHVVNARVFSTDLASGPVATLNGNVTVNLGENPPSITGSSAATNKARLQTSLLNIHATNGVIHVIDKVLIPQ